MWINRLGLICCIVFALSGCKTIEVATTVKRPAEINMAGYDRVTVGEFDGPGGKELRGRLIAAIAATNLYEVLDRDSIGARATEQQLQQLGMSESDSGEAAMVAANTLIVGEVLRSEFDQDKETQQVERYENNSSYYVNQSRNVGHVRVSTMLQVIDLDTMHVVAPANLSAERHVVTNWVDQGYYPPDIDPDPLVEQCHAEIVANFMRKIAPYDETIAVQLYTTVSDPANGMGVKYFESGDFRAALDQFELALERLLANPKTKPKALSRVYFNTAVALEYTGYLDEAMEHYAEAQRLYFDSLYVSSAQRCERRLVDREIFRIQGQTDQF